MSTFAYGFHYDMGKRTGYDISTNGDGSNIYLHGVSYADKKRIINEIKKLGYTDDEIECIKVETNYY